MADWWNPIEQTGNAIGDIFSNVTGIGRNSESQNFSNLWFNPKPKSPTPTPRSTPGSRGSTAGMSDYEKEMARLQGEYNSLIAQANRPAPPVVVRNFKYDTNQGLATAKSMAESALNPIYKKNMDDFINRQTTLLGQKTTNITADRAGLDTVFNRLIEDNTVARDRSATDTASNINEINTSRGVAAREDGLNFDVAQRAMNEGLGASGTAESGMGQQQIDDASAKMTRQSNEEVRQSTNKVAAAETLLSRTFEDLTRSDTRGKENLTTGNERLTVDLNQYIETQNLDKTDFTNSQGMARATGIAAYTQSAQSQLVGKWIQSLSASGATPQEILLAAQTYGR